MRKSIFYLSVYVLQYKILDASYYSYQDRHTISSDDFLYLLVLSYSSYCQFFHPSDGANRVLTGGKSIWFVSGEKSRR